MIIRIFSVLGLRRLPIYLGVWLSFTNVYAQPVPPPVFPAVDERGVDVTTLDFVHAQTDVVIGNPGAGGLAYTRYYRSGPGGSSSATSNYVGYVYGTGTTCSVVLGISTERFTSSGSGCTGTFTPDQQVGSTLAYDGTDYTYTMRDGTVVTFTRMQDNDPDYTYHAVLNLDGANAYITSVLRPTGELTSYTYEWGGLCYPSPGFCYLVNWLGRIQTISNNLGYRLWFQYPSDPTTWVQANRVTGINNTVEYCVPPSCAQSWPSANFTYGSGSFSDLVMTASNGVGDTTTYTYSGDLLTEIQFPDHPSHTVTIGYTSDKVSSIDLGFGTWTYAYQDISGARYTTVTNPDSSTRQYNLFLSNGRIFSVYNELNQTIANYQYDSAGRPTNVIRGGGVTFTDYTYDSRGNVTEIRRRAPAGSGLPHIVTSASFPASCTNPRTCNQPTSTTDAAGFRTDYTYDSTHGGVLTITAPAPSGPAPLGSGDRPETRFTYAQFQAHFLINTTTWTNGSAVWRSTVESACAFGTAPSCLGTANETRITTAYPSAGTPNNVLPASLTVAAGNGSVSATSAMTYTNWGDVQTVDGPLPGSADTTRTYYDSMRRPTGVVGPDPDAGGSLKYRAVRTTYNTVGQPTVVERGTVTNQGDSAFSTFVALEKQDTEYDQHARPVKQRAWDGASIAALTQFSYDNRGRLSCTAVRMNPATFSSPPSDACTLGTPGPFGGDRISRTLYDVVGRVSAKESAYGTALAQTTVAYTYTYTGQIETLKDARNYLTTYEYDGHERLTKLRYPDPSSTNLSSTTDYEQFTFDAYGRPYEQRRRSGELFTLTWDNLGRLALRDAPGTQPDVSHGYDLLNRETSTSHSGNTLTTAYDALSRVTSVTSNVLGVVSYPEYDAAGRRKRMDYPGGFYVTYGYNTAGELTGIFENGSSSLAAYGYDDLGRRTSLSRGNGVVTSSNTFDALSRLDTLTLDAGGSSHDTTFDHGYNPSSQIASRTRTNGVFDWVSPPSFSDSYTANGLNQYTNVGGVTPGHDTRGNLTTNGAKTYGYDYDNRMISASGGISLNYDPAGRLHEVAGTATTRFLYDGANIIAEYNTSGAVLRRYVHGPGTDEPLVWYEGSGISDKRYLMADERGSVIGVTNSSGTVTTVNRYDAYGVPGASNDGRFQYTGQAWLSDVGLYHYKARVYDPKLGRFLQTDPIGTAGGVNLYAYVGNDPVNLKDPSGLQTDYACDGSEDICVTGRRDSMEFMNWWLSKYDGSSSLHTLIYGPDGSAYGWPSSNDPQEGHGYDRDEHVCKRAMTDAEQRILVRKFTIPSIFATSRVTNDDGLYLVTNSWGIPGGWVQTTFFQNGLIGQNVTTPVHVFVGTVERSVQNRADGAHLVTRGYGTAPLGPVMITVPGIYTGIILTGPIRDSINTEQGPDLFAPYDRQATRYATHHFPGC
jgi:RHS repeat-associated protein